MEKNQKSLGKVAIGKPRKSSGRHPEVKSQMGQQVHSLLLTQGDEDGARRWSEHMRLVSDLARIVNSQNETRGDEKLAKAPDSRKDCNYGYAFAASPPSSVSPSFRLVARSDDGEIPAVFSDPGQSYHLVTVQKVEYAQLGPLRPPGKWPAPEGGPPGSQGDWKIDCVEVKLLHRLRTELPLKQAAIVNLFTERLPCASCCTVIQNYLESRSKDTLRIIYGFGFYRDPRLLTEDAARKRRTRYARLREIQGACGARLLVSSLIEQRDEMGGGNLPQPAG